MTPLPIPVPPQLEAAVGYPDDARWFTLCWTCCGDTCIYDDARSCGTGTGRGYLGWVRHPAVEPHLRDADMGSSEEDGTQRLVIDRQERKACLASAAEARRVVTGQWPAEPAVELTREEWDAVVERIREAMLNRPIPSMSDLMRQLQEHSRLVAEMVAWLDRWVASGGREMSDVRRRPIPPPSSDDPDTVSGSALLPRSSRRGSGVARL